MTFRVYAVVMDAVDDFDGVRTRYRVVTDPRRVPSDSHRRRCTAPARSERRHHRRRLDHLQTPVSTRTCYISRESKTTRNVLWSRASVCVSVCVCLSAAACLQYCTDPDVTWGSGPYHCPKLYPGPCNTVSMRPLVVHYWADLQSVHGMCCYGNIMEMRGRAQR